MEKEVYFISEIRIKRLIQKRIKYLNNKKDQEADEIELEITQSIKKYFQMYNCDFIIETLTHFGQAPNIVYDDNGLFAVSSIGVQPVVMGNEKIKGELIVFVEKQMWKKTIREAIWYYLNVK